MIDSIRIELVKLELPPHPETLEKLPHHPAGLKLAEIVNPRAEQVAVQGKGVGPASREIVLLENKHLLPRVGQGNGGCEPTGSRTDDNGIKISHLATRTFREEEVTLNPGPSKSKNEQWGRIRGFFFPRRRWTTMGPDIKRDQPPEDTCPELTSTHCSLQ